MRTPSGKLSETIFLVATLCTTSASALESWSQYRTSPDKSVRATVSAIEKMKWWDVCVGWGREYRRAKSAMKADVMLAFLIDEEMINGIDRAHVGDHTVAIGMTECGVLASLGKPSSVNTTETALSSTAQLVYDHPRKYVYTERGTGRMRVVRAIQY